VRSEIIRSRVTAEVFRKFVIAETEQELRQPDRPTGDAL
jgi:hypothetical protein